MKKSKENAITQDYSSRDSSETKSIDYDAIEAYMRQLLEQRPDDESSSDAAVTVPAGRERQQATATIQMPAGGLEETEAEDAGSDQSDAKTTPGLARGKLARSANHRLVVALVALVASWILLEMSGGIWLLSYFGGMLCLVVALLWIMRYFLITRRILNLEVPRPPVATNG